ncbi:MAG: DUF350 domain-containing protein [Cyclobacteriaceae bacterium]
MLPLFDDILETLVYLAVSFLLFFIGKTVYQWFHPGVKVNYELVEHDNFAFSIAYVGYFIGLLAAIGSALLGESAGLVQDLIDIGIYGALSILLLNLSILINDKLILRKFDVKKEIVEDRNVGTGVVEGAMAVSTGLIVLGAIHGEGHGAGGPIITAVLYWILGQALMYVTSLVYNLITPYDIHEHIKKGNIAVGIGFAGALIAIGNLIRFALMHDFEDWLITLEGVALDVGIGLVFLPIVRFLADKILLPGQNLTDELVNQEHPNNGAALVEAFAYIGGSVLITWLL